MSSASPFGIPSAPSGFNPFGPRPKDPSLSMSPEEHSASVEYMKGELKDAKEDLNRITKSMDRELETTKKFAEEICKLRRDNCRHKKLVKAQRHVIADLTLVVERREHGEDSGEE